MKNFNRAVLLAFLFMIASVNAGVSHSYAGEAIFPKDFLWGVATSSYQVEGGILNNDWSEFEKTPGHIKNNDKCANACEHYTRYAEDLDAACAINAKIYRMSIEWSRIEPREGVFDENEIAHYRSVLTEARKRGMVPFVTLFHFCTPAWLANKGGFTNPESSKYFERYCGFVSKNLGDLVDCWTTQNETMVYLTSGYLAGMWAPGKKNPALFWIAFGNLIKSHGKAYRIIKANDAIDADGDGNPAAVGIVMNYGIIDPYDRNSSVNRFITEKINYLANHLLLDSITTGGAKSSQFAGADGENGKRILFLPEEPNTLDFIGVNYYTRFLVKLSVTDPITGLGQTATRAAHNDYRGHNFECNEMGWLIYPEGIYRAVTAVKKYDLPIYITENGIPDRTGKKRVKYIADHLIQLKRAIDDGAPVKGYIHWALMDNFEWAEGFWPQFGLYSMDYKTQKRTLTEGGAFFAETARNNGITAEMYEKVYKTNQNETLRQKFEELEKRKK